MLGLTISSKSNWGSYIISITKTASKKIGALICSMKFLSPDVALYLYKPTMECYFNVWLVLLVAIWNCWISYKSGYAGLLILHLLSLLNHWAIIEM